jgi:hypothetical protein
LQQQLQYYLEDNYAKNKGGYGKTSWLDQWVPLGGSIREEKKEEKRAANVAH